MLFITMSKLTTEFVNELVVIVHFFIVGALDVSNCIGSDQKFAPYHIVLF